MKRSRRKFNVVVLAVTIAILLSVISRIENWKRDLTTNFARLDPASDDPLLRPVILEHSVQDVAVIIEQWAESQSRWSIESSEPSGSEATIHLVRRTRFLRFADDIRVRLVADGTGTRVEAESKSRVGKGDLGQNPRNLRELVSALTQHR